ncbi:MAG: hypothetical protein ACRDGR_04945 [bacterium]
MERIRVAAVTPGARLITSSAPTQGAFSMETSWELAFDQAWPAYCELFEKSLPPGYDPQTPRGESVTFVKRLPSDTFRVDVALVEDGPPIRVRVTFQAQAG